MSESEKYLAFLLLLLIRYFVIAGGAFLVFYVFYKNRFRFKKIQAKFPTRKDYLREIAYSILTFFIFAGVALFLWNDHVRPYTQIYGQVSDKGWGYLLVSVIVIIFLQDTYFYWMHRLMHHPKLFKLFHLVHHKSTNPSPWAAFAFHPLEAIVEASILVIIAFTIPVHHYAILTFLIFLTLYSVYGHLGYEIYPKWLLKHPIAKWLNTSTNHNMHHKFFKTNYSLYFRFWDVWMGSTHKAYEDTFQEVTNRKKIS